MRMARHRLAAMLLAALILLGARPAAANEVREDSFGGRDMLVYAPAQLPPKGARALVVVLHGGLGNARRIASGQAESGLNLDAVAERNGFIVAYLNGTPVTRLGGEMLGWNAGGGCCGQSAARDVDDVGYIKGAAGYLARKYGVDPRRVFGIGHSNGAMMTQRLMCETDLYAAAVAISGPLNTGAKTCSAARGKRILAIHGAEDENVPVAGGRGSKGVSGVAYRSEAESRQVFTASGAAYDLDLVQGADHYLDHIDAAIQRTDGQSIAEKAARFFGLVKRDR
jgi:polyhydroxybutyrate depolymerase